MYNHSDNSFLQLFEAFCKPAGHREVAPREFDVHSRWKPEREAEGKRRRRIRRRRRRRRKRRARNIRKNMKGRRRQSLKTDAACVASAGCNNLLAVYQKRTAPPKVAPGTMYEPLA